MIIGNFIMLNLFLAILLGNFQESRERIEEERRNKLKEESRHSQVKSMRIDSTHFALDEDAAGDSPDKNFSSKNL